MNTKHTPGPWVVNPVQLNQICTADARQEVARATVYHDAHETIANARLIAAAPEQNSALIGLLELVEELDCLAASNDPRAIAARAAIAKAEAA